LFTRIVLSIAGFPDRQPDLLAAKLLRGLRTRSAGRAQAIVA
jgi:hypothetical protein